MRPVETRGGCMHYIDERGRPDCFPRWRAGWVTLPSRPFAAMKSILFRNVLKFEQKGET
jgi:hypothetical protein